MKLSKKIGFLLLYTTITISIVISSMYAFIYNKLNKSSIDIIINYKGIFFTILFLMVISNILIYCFINTKITKRLKVTEETIENVIYKDIKEKKLYDNKYRERDEITNLHNEISNVMDKLLDAKKYLKVEERNYSNILNAMSNAFFHLKAIEDENGDYIDGIVIDINYAASDFLELDREKIINKKLSELYEGFDIYKNKVIKVLKRIKQTKSECFARELNVIGDKWGVISIYFLNEGYFSIIINDVTEIKKHSEELTYLANYDTLTNLLNRHNLLEYMMELINKEEEFSIYFIDIDDFKNINDTLGHNTGDEVLRIAADKLLELKYSFDMETFNKITVGRVGGDEFLVVKEGKDSISEMKLLAKNILDALNKQFNIGMHTFNLKASIGISSYPSDGDNVFTLIKYADISMYRCKEEGGSRYKIFSEEMLEEINMQSSLSSAINNKEFEVYFQPIYDVNKEKIVAAEALTRWNTPEGIISPARYIPLAKKTGDIIKLDEFVLEEACKCCKTMQELGEKDFKVSINISYSAIKQSNLIEKLLSIINKEGIPPGSIKLEITEDEIIDNIDFTVNILNKLRELGFNIALDDFGVGYSSFNYIKILPLDTLKIDRSLLKSLEKDKKTLAIIETLIKLSHTLGLDVVCEGVEIHNQLELLKKINCDNIQGFYISKPIDFNSFKNFIIDFNKIERRDLSENNKEGREIRRV